MIKTFKSINNNQIMNADLCLIGSGPASLSILEYLKNEPIKIIVVPGGSISENKDNQNLYKGIVNNKNSHEPLDVNRHREFGGSGNHWGGRCVPLDAIDLKRRNWIKESGWPIKFDVLTKYYRKASKFLRVNNYNKDKNFELKNIKKIIPKIDDKFLISSKLENWSPILNFKKEFLKIFKQKNITMIENSHLLKINTDKKKVINIFCTVSGSNFFIKSKYYVLACGGIENARLLLNSKNTFHPKGIGNSNDLVGRYYMAHHSGIFYNFSPFLRKNLNYKYSKDAKGIYHRNRFWFTENFQKNKEIGNSIFFFLNTQLFKDMGKESNFFELLNLLRLFKNKEYKILKKKFYKNKLSIMKNFIIFIPKLLSISYLRLKSNRLPSILPSISSKYFGIYHQFEQTPCFNSRIKLVNQKDKLGLKKVKLSIKFNSIDFKTLCENYKYLNSIFLKKNIGKFQNSFNQSILKKKYLKKIKTFNSSAHHIGTTRMGNSKKNGVVDKNLQIFDCDNLYVAGSSTFPTGGHANPTYTIIALSLKLGDYLKNKLKKK